MKSPISQREIRAVVVKLHNEGITGNEFDATFTQYILECCGIDYACPTTIYKPYPDMIKHRVNEVSKEKLVENIEYWKKRFWTE
jgi:hypothetical protein